MSTLLEDLRFAVRQLAKSPGFAAIGIFSVAVGIGVTTLVFSVVGALVFRSYALPDGPDGVRVGAGRSLTRAECERLRSGVRPQAALAAVRPGGATLVTGAGSERLGIEVVSEDYFATLGHRPALGRLFGVGADAGGSGQGCVISHG